MPTIIYAGQGVAKDCYAGDRSMDRYSVFNGLEQPRLIDRNMQVSPLGYELPVITSVSASATAGSITAGKWYAYVAVYASAKHTRPVAVADGTSNYTRGNPSLLPISILASTTSNDVVVPSSTNGSVTHILLYRSIGQSTEAAAKAGPFYYTTKGVNAVGDVTINDGVAETLVGLAVETDNNQPNAYRYATTGFNRIFMGGNFPLGGGYTCTVTPGSSLVTANTSIFFDGIIGWTFKCTNDATGGIDGAGRYYANYVNSNTIQLVDENNAAKVYNGSLNGAGQIFSVFLPGNVLRWTKESEPEACPTANTILFEGDITGIAVMPNLPLLIVCTDTPNMWVLDMTLLGTATFKTSKRLVSTEYTTQSHYSLCNVEGLLRGIDVRMQCIWECNGVAVRDITKQFIPKIWTSLSNDASKIKNWHCAYDPNQKLFGAFVAYGNSQRICDFAICQHVVTGGWFFNFEKDLLCTASYTDPVTSEQMTLGGTQGVSGQTGAVWGRIWCPDIWDEWFPQGSLRSGFLTSATATSVTVDVSGGTNLWTTGSGLTGRWVLITDPQGEQSQLGYIASNTADTVTVDSVTGGVATTQFSPVPAYGWKFYIGMIEMRWGPKRFDFADSDRPKVVNEVHVVMDHYTRTDLPIIRLYRGLDTGYTVQQNLIEGTYRDASTENNCLYQRYSAIEESTRWGIALVDRSYDATELKNMTLVFHVIGANNSADKRQN
jgi:hypothetical protein